MSLNVTPSRLRSYHAMAVSSPKTASWAPIMASDCGMLADALEIADSCARADIECNVPAADDDAAFRAGGLRQYDTAQMTPEDQRWLPQILRYLDARGLLIRDSQRPDVVSLKAPA